MIIKKVTFALCLIQVSRPVAVFFWKVAAFYINVWLWFIYGQESLQTKILFVTPFNFFFFYVSQLMKVIAQQRTSVLTAEVLYFYQQWRMQEKYFP